MHPDVEKKLREIERLRQAGYPASHPAIAKAKRELALLRKATK